MQKLIKAQIDHYQNVTFAELTTIDTEQDKIHSLKLAENLFVWTNMSAEFVNAIETLIEKDKIHFGITGWLDYVVDGKVLPFPVTYRIKKYREPHWIPVSLMRGRRVK